MEIFDKKRLISYTSLQGDEWDGEHGELVLGHALLDELERRDAVGCRKADLARQQHRDHRRHQRQPHDLPQQRVRLEQP